MEAVINIPEVIMDALMLISFGLIIVALCTLIATLWLDIQWSSSQRYLLATGGGDVEFGGGAGGW